MTNEIKNVPELRFPEFKEEWVEKKLGEITSKISDGIHSTPTYDSNGDIYFINGNNLVNGRIDFKTSKKISVQEFNKYKNYLEAKNTLLLSINGTIGNIAKYEGENILLGKSAAYINVVSKFISRCYIFYYLQTSKIYESFLRELTGTTIKNLSLKSIKNIIVYISELDEQQKIGNFFSKLDRQIELEEQKLEKLEEQKKEYMQKIFSQKLRFKDENGDEYPEWKSKKLKDIANVYQPQNLSQNNFQKKGYPVYGANGVIGYYKDFNHSNMEIAVACRGNTCGRVNLTEPKSWITSNAMVVNIIDKMEIEFYFLYQYLRIINYSNVISGSGQPQITRKNMNSVELLVPNYIEQQKIGNLFRRFDDFIEGQSQKIELLKDRKKGFLQKMFV